MVKAVATLKDRFGIAPILQVLGVAASTYYGWLAQQRVPSTRRRADTELLVRARNDSSCTTESRFGTHDVARFHGREIRAKVLGESAGRWRPHAMPRASTRPRV